MPHTIARKNPFRTECTDALTYRFQEAGWVQLWDRLEAQGWRGALIGGKGCGKSTLLDELAQRLHCKSRNIIRLRLNSSQRNLTPCDWAALRMASASDFILLDGAEQLRFFHRRRFLHLARRAGGVIITSHRAGILPTLYKCRNSPELLYELVIELTTDEGYISPAKWDVETAGVLLARHEGNLREVLRELYDIYPTLPPVKFHTIKNPRLP